MPTYFSSRNVHTSCRAVCCWKNQLPYLQGCATCDASAPHCRRGPSGPADAGRDFRCPPVARSDAEEAWRGRTSGVGGSSRAGLLRATVCVSTQRGRARGGDTVERVRTSATTLPPGARVGRVGGQSGRAGEVVTGMAAVVAVLIGRAGTTPSLLVDESHAGQSGMLPESNGGRSDATGWRGCRALALIGRRSSAAADERPRAILVANDGGVGGALVIRGPCSVGVSRSAANDEDALSLSSAVVRSCSKSSSESSSCHTSRQRGGNRFGCRPRSKAR